jgi:hypothetical protein
MEMKGRVVKQGKAEGEALACNAPVGFYGSVNPDTGVMEEKGHPLQGKSLAGKILVFTTGKGSTVGSYTLYRMKKNGVAPKAMVCAESEPINAVGAIISDIPMVDKIDVTKIKTGDKVRIENEVVEIG